MDIQDYREVWIIIKTAFLYLWSYHPFITVELVLLFVLSQVCLYKHKQSTHKE